MYTIKYGSLENQMSNLAGIIDRMLNVVPRPVRSCQEHIYKLEEMIVDLLMVANGDNGQQQDDQLVTKYRDMVVTYWQKLECPDSVGVWSPGRPSQYNLVSQSYQGNSFGSSGDSPIITGVHKSKAIADCNHSLAVPSANAIRDTLEAAFDRLSPVESIDTDTEGMKRLLILVTKARAITMSHWKDFCLLTDIFTWAFDKLPATQQTLYCEQYNGERKWLRDLRNFIQDELHIYNLERFEVAEKQSGEETPVVMGNCWYCKTAGHLMNQCPVLESTLCPKCFHWSHSEQRCPNAMLYVKLEDIF